MRNGTAGDSRPRTRSRIAGAFVLGAATVLSDASSGPILIDFEDQPPYTIINAQYASKGVIFQGAFVATDLGGRSGTRALRSIPPTSEVFQPVPLVITFTSPQTRVSLYADSPGVSRNGTLQAFDANGALLVQDGPKPVAADAFLTRFEVKSPKPAITKAVLQLENAAHYAIDDLELDSRGGPQKPPVEVIETRQPAAAANPAVRGIFPDTWVVKPPPEPKKRPSPKQEPEAGEAEERFDMKFAPSVQRELAPGASAELKAAVQPRTGLAGSVRWSGTAMPLPVALSVNGLTVATGRSYALGQNRGGADLGAVAESAGEAKLSVINRSSVKVKVLLNLGMAPPNDGAGR